MRASTQAGVWRGSWLCFWEGPGGWWGGGVQAEGAAWEKSREAREYMDGAPLPVSSFEGGALSHGCIGRAALQMKFYGPGSNGLQSTLPVCLIYSERLHFTKPLMITV